MTKFSVPTQPDFNLEIRKLTPMDVLTSLSDVVVYMESLELTAAEVEIQLLKDRAETEKVKKAVELELYGHLQTHNIKTNESQREAMLHSKLLNTAAYVEALSNSTETEEILIRLKGLLKTYQRYLTLFLSIKEAALSAQKLQASSLVL